MLLQEGKGRRLGETVLFPQKQVLPAGDGEICSEPGDLLRHLRTHAEQVLRRGDPVRIRVRADGDRKTQFGCQGQQGPDDPVLDRRKAGEAVQKKHCVPDQPALRKIPAQHGQQLLRRDPVGGDEFPEGAVEHREVAELLPEGQPYRAGAVLRRPVQHLRRHPVLVKLGDHGFHMGSESRLAQPVPPDRQPVRFRGRDSAEHHRFARIVHDARAADAALLKDPPCQAVKAQDLDIRGGMLRVKLQHALLHHHPVLLRDQKKEMTFLLLQGFPDHGPERVLRLPAPGRSEHKAVAHRLPSQLLQSCFVSDSISLIFSSSMLPSIYFSIIRYPSSDRNSLSSTASPETYRTISPT